MTVKAAYGHSTIATTERYLHARPAAEQAARFTAAFAANAIVGQSADADRMERLLEEAAGLDADVLRAALSAARPLGRSSPTTLDSRAVQTA